MSHVDRDDIEVRELIVEHLEDELRFARSIADAVAKEMKLTVDEVRAKEGPVRMIVRAAGSQRRDRRCSRRAG